MKSEHHLPHPIRYPSKDPMLKPTSSMRQHRRVPGNVEAAVVACLARKESHATILDYLEKEFDYSMANETITRIRARNEKNITELRKVIILQEATTADQLLGQSHRLIGKQFARVETNMHKLAELDRKLETKEISKIDYDAEVKRLNLPKMNELVSASREMHRQVNGDNATPLLPNATGSDQIQAKLEQIKKLVATGDEVVLERIIFNPKS
jgi:hypothetical protein